MHDPTQPGQHIDHYVVEQLVARTPTASILRAKDRRTGREIAIKMPHADVEGDLVFYQRFQREQEICERLDHPAVVKAFAKECGQQSYIAMEFAEGQTLRRVLDESRRLPADRALKIAVNIAEALDYIHARAVIHRDLKPENLIVDAEDRITLIDFGIASIAGARRLTFGKLSQVMGTPDYIAPEQVRGKRCDARTDIYALGVILYEMLTGETPFPGTEPFAVMNSRLINDPVSPREIDPAIGEEMEAILYRALERNPRNRYASARAFMNDLLDPEGVARTRGGRHRKRQGRLSLAGLSSMDFWRAFHWPSWD